MCDIITFNHRAPGSWSSGGFPNGVARFFFFFFSFFYICSYRPGPLYCVTNTCVAPWYIWVHQQGLIILVIIARRDLFQKPGRFGLLACCEWMLFLWSFPWSSKHDFLNSPLTRCWWESSRQADLLRPPLKRPRVKGDCLKAFFTSLSTDVLTLRQEKMTFRFRSIEFVLEA